jgi:hypothetical protein
MFTPLPGLGQPDFPLLDVTALQPSQAKDAVCRFGTQTGEDLRVSLPKGFPHRPPCPVTGGQNLANDGDYIVPSCRDKGSTGAVGSARTKVARGYAGGSSRLSGRVVLPETAESGSASSGRAAACNYLDGPPSLPDDVPGWGSSASALSGSLRHRIRPMFPTR